MRTGLICASGAMAAIAAIFVVSDPSSARGQEASNQVPGSPGNIVVAPFDSEAQHAYLRDLPEQDRARAIPLRSRIILADPDCPVPSASPRQPVYVKFSRDLTRVLADRISALGVDLIGYARPHVHVLRARDGASLLRLQELLRREPNVLGTALQAREDKLSRGLHERGAAPGVAAYRVLFWRDTPVAEARALLAAAGGEILEAATDAQGRPDFSTPWLDLRLSPQGLAVIEASVWVENLSPAPWRLETNQVSVAMAKADGATIGVAPYNLDGSNQIVGVWDSGPARDTHEQFQNAPAASLISNGSKRVLRVDTSTNTNHGTHVTGTIIGDGTNNAAARGFAPKAYVLSHDWNNIDQERRAAKHNWNHVADNHSYADFNGSSDDWGDYTAGTQQVDYTNRDLLLCQVQSAGNYASTQPGGTGTKPFSGGTCTVPSYNAHRNGFIIAAAMDNMDITGFSSRGPALDGRLVPQFCANGDGLTSAIASSNTAYASYSGTSMSGPSFCGSMALLSQLWRREHSDRLFAPDEARSILALTAQDRGSAGPDYIFGFGIVDVQAAADLILADKAGGGSRIVRGQVRQGGVVQYTVNVSSSSAPLRVAMSWLDVYATINASVTLVNDLDVELEDPTGGLHYPYSGLLACAAGAQNHVFTTTGPNRRDNVELVHVDAPAAGTWILRVRGYSIPASPQTGVPNDVQGFVLACSHDVATQKLTFEDSLNGAAPVAIPDNAASGVTRSFVVSDSRVISQVRLYARIHHQRRGDLRIELEHPDGTRVLLKGVASGDNDDYTDIIAVFPDTRQHNQDVTALMHKHVSGTWSVNISDQVSGNTGSIHYLALDMDLRVNNDPVADAGVASSLRETLGGQLDGSASADADGDTLSFLWTQLGGPAVTLSSDTVANPTFTAPNVSVDSVVTFQLRVTDTSGDFSTDTVQFTIFNNQAPIADAGADFAVLESDPVQLDAGTSSDPESDSISFAWAQLSGPTVSLAVATTATPAFTAPAVTANETLTFQVTVTDSFGDSAVDTVNVTVEVNLAPSASAGADFAVAHGATGNLNATASVDPNTGDTISYLWVQTGGTAMVALSDPTSSQPSFVAPATDDVLTFQVTVTDLRGLTDTDSVSVWVNALGTMPAGNSGGGGSKKGGGGCAGQDGLTLWWLATPALALVLVLRRRRLA